MSTRQEDGARTSSLWRDYSLSIVVGGSVSDDICLLQGGCDRLAPCCRHAIEGPAIASGS